MEKEIHGFIGVANYAMQRLLDGMFRIPDFLMLFECVVHLGFGLNLLLGFGLNLPFGFGLNLLFCAMCVLTSCVYGMSNI